MSLFNLGHSDIAGINCLGHREMSRDFSSTAERLRAFRESPPMTREERGAPRPMWWEESVNKSAELRYDSDILGIESAPGSGAVPNERRVPTHANGGRQQYLAKTQGNGTFDSSGSLEESAYPLGPSTVPMPMSRNNGNGNSIDYSASGYNTTIRDAYRMDQNQNHKDKDKENSANANLKTPLSEALRDSSELDIAIDLKYDVSREGTYELVNKKEGRYRSDSASTCVYVS